MTTPPPSAEEGVTAYVNGTVVTVDAEFTIAEAFAVAGGRVVAVGATSQILARTADAVVDLGGRMVLPGFVDAHAHTAHRAIEQAAHPSLAGVRSVRGILDAIRAAAQQARPGDWIVTSPVGQAPDYFDVPAWLDERRWPTRAELDAAAPHNPVYLPTPMARPNPAVLNTAALTAVGLDGPPAGGGVRCDLDPGTGRPTGLVHGLSFYNAASPVWRRLTEQLPSLSSADLAAAIAGAMRENLAAGITAIYEGHVNAFTAVYRELHARGELPHRVVCTYEVPRFGTAEELEAWFEAHADAAGAGTGDELLRILGVTVGMDGAIQFGKALMRKPYADPHGAPGNGASAFDHDDLVLVAEAALRHDTRLNVLAAGDAAIDLAVGALRSVDARTPLRDRRWVAQHFQHPSPAHISELARMGFVAQTYSSVDFSKGTEVYRGRLGGELWRSAVPLRWWFDGGVVLAQGSDGSHIDPLFQIWASLRRVDGHTGESLLAAPKQVTREEAIASYTRNGAVVMQAEELIGSIEPGRLADFAVLDTNILTCAVDQIRQARVVATALGGQLVHDTCGLGASGTA
jgi:predicted amidohydrolase YtcJ